MHRVCILYVKCALTYYIPDSCNCEPCLIVSICFRRINHMAVGNHLHSSSGVWEVVLSTLRLGLLRGRLPYRWMVLKDDYVSIDWKHFQSGFRAWGRRRKGFLWIKNLQVKYFATQFNCQRVRAPCQTRTTGVVDFVYVNIVTWSVGCKRVG